MNSTGPGPARKHADLQGRKRPAGVAVAHLGQELQGVVVQMDLVLAQPALLVGHGPPEQRLDVVARKRLELEDAAAADQRAVDREERVFGGRADEDHHALFHVGQQHVLLGLVEAVDFVDEQQRPLALGREPVVGRREDFAQFLHAAGDRADLLEMAAAFAGQQPGQRGLARARRTVEDHRAEPIGRQQPAEQFPFAEKVLLADELVERGRPHPRRQAAALRADWPLRCLRTRTWFSLQYSVYGLQ